MSNYHPPFEAEQFYDIYNNANGGDKLIEIKNEKKDGKVVLDLELLKGKLEECKEGGSGVEFYYNKSSIKLANEPENIEKHSL